ncbi:YdaS family helix-turn-helix protein [Burkholderia anthina]|uniref:YdaS family helix-turn-helix protein n=1 Tax=Burkholderia anthina TaxID=179879 RepID=UPI00158871DA
MKLADYLAKHRITQSTLAKHLGVTQGRVWQWLNGEPVPPKYCPTIERWSSREIRCEDLNGSVDWGVLRAELGDGSAADASDDVQPPAGTVDDDS